MNEWTMAIEGEGSNTTSNTTSNTSYTIHFSFSMNPTMTYLLQEQLKAVFSQSSATPIDHRPLTIDHRPLTVQQLVCFILSSGCGLLGAYSLHEHMIYDPEFQN